MADPNALVSGMVDLLRRSLGATIEIEPRLAEKLPMIMVDLPLRLPKIFRASSTAA